MIRYETTDTVINERETIVRVWAIEGDKETCISEMWVIQDGYGIVKVIQTPITFFG